MKAADLSSCLFLVEADQCNIYLFLPDSNIITNTAKSNNLEYKHCFFLLERVLLSTRLAELFAGSC